MKKLIIISLFMGCLHLSAQESYFTTYNFSVAAEDVSTVYKLVDDYYSKNKTEGVSVYLFENHFNDSGNNFTHSIVFAGSLDALGGMYSGGGQTDSWQLFITRINQHLESNFSSAMGTRIASYGDTSTPHPIQRYIILDAEDGDALEAGFRKFHSEHDPDEVISMLGNFRAGTSPEGENRWVIIGYQDFKGAMGGEDMYLSEDAKSAREKAWDEYMASHGGVRVVRTGLRILLGSW